MITNDDWRLQGQEKYLLGKTFYWREYNQYSDNWKHDHCAFCLDKFSEGSGPEDLHEGYTTEDNYHWVCNQCFEDFREKFHWTVGK
ncbi:hypothetical protein HPT25_27755 [Bacillus sp. BRMEA1]|uniref:hypothetical protein n=1 Tax=Neobacillus endophyticus TaxID=2738405 RepID=UPI0015664716|nr:hypothetical protein [Neobacillus endophyticus]NRD79862.1 hypothetical protein [Neobacillus endophyticus]NRD81092.1 hypothetical protein [Neobacillus endophyticus]